ncbi:hypothetical protein EMIT051CA3_40549 [Pseudomonas chlororaphis]
MITSIDLQYRKLLSLDPIELTEQGLKTISTHLTLPAGGTLLEYKLMILSKVSQQKPCSSLHPQDDKVTIRGL